MYWADRNEATFKYNTEALGYQPYLNVAFSVLGYLLFALVIVGSHKKGILKKYATTVFLILVCLFAFDIFETGQTLYFIFNTPDQNPDVPFRSRREKLNSWASRHDIVTLPTTVWACNLSYSLFALPSSYLSSVFVDGIISIFRFVVHFCCKNAIVTLSYVVLGIFLAITFSHVSYANMLGPVVCTAFNTVHEYFIEAFLLSCITIAFITPIFPIQTLIKGAAKKHNETGVTTFLLLSSLPSASIVICCIIARFAWRGHAQLFQAIIHGLFTFQQFRFLILCLLTTVIINEIRDAVLSTISDIIRSVFKRDISVSINVDVFHLETGEKKHIEKMFTI